MSDNELNFVREKVHITVYVLKVALFKNRLQTRTTDQTDRLCSVTISYRTQVKCYINI